MKKKYLDFFPQLFYKWCFFEIIGKDIQMETCLGGDGRGVYDVIFLINANMGNFF